MPRGTRRNTRWTSIHFKENTMRGSSNFVEELPPVAQIKLRRHPLVAALLLPFAISAVASQSAAAAVLPVANCNDAGSGSLRDMVASAHGGDTIDLRSLACDHISLTSGGLAIAVDDLVLQGRGSAKLTIDSEASKPFHAVIQHSGVGALRVDSLRITDGGAGIVSSGTLSLNESVVTGCANAGISAHGLIMQNSAVSNNGYTGVVVNAGQLRSPAQLSAAISGVTVGV
jgi:hypothetical protein